MRTKIGLTTARSLSLPLCITTLVSSACFCALSPSLRPPIEPLRSSDSELLRALTPIINYHYPCPQSAEQTAGRILRILLAFMLISFRIGPESLGITWNRLKSLSVLSSRLFTDFLCSVRPVRLTRELWDCQNGLPSLSEFEWRLSLSRVDETRNYRIRPFTRRVYTPGLGSRPSCPWPGSSFQSLELLQMLVHADSVAKLQV